MQDPAEPVASTGGYPVLLHARRKSCIACARAKRRCDLGVPLCSRCVERQLDCVYTPVVSNRKRRTVRISSLQPQAGAQRAKLDVGAEAVVHPDGIDFDSICDETTPLATGGITMDDTVGFDACVLEPPSLVDSTTSSAFDMMNYIFSTNLSNATTSTSSPSTTPFPLPFDFLPTDITNLEFPFNFHQTVDITKALGPVLRPKPFPTLPYSSHTISPVALYTTTIDPRLHFALEQFRSAPLQMVTECKTPWSHALLYTEHTINGRLPSSMATAQACCALHIARNKTNSGIITRNIVQRARELCREPLPTHLPSSRNTTLTSTSTSTASSSSNNNNKDTTTLELLARTQALLLFHIMLHADNDPLARDTLPHTASALESVVMALYRRTTALSSPYIAGSEPEPIDWRHWGKSGGHAGPGTTTSSCSSWSSRAPAEDDEGQDDQRGTDLSASPWLTCVSEPHESRESHQQQSQPGRPRPATHTNDAYTTTTSSSSSSSTAQKPTPKPKPMPAFLPISPVHQTRPTYKSWLLHESARRTVLAAGIFAILQRFLVHSPGPGVPGSNQVVVSATPPDCPAGGDDMREFCASPFTASRECWEDARDCVDFAAGWNRRGWTVLRAADFEHGLTSLNHLHVDSFAKMILTLLFGIDETKGWLLWREARVAL